MKLLLEGLEGNRLYIVVGVGILVLLILFFLVWWIKTKNWFRRSLVKIEESKSAIDVALTKRHDSLTKLLGITKGYAKHESETLEKVIKWRSGASEMSLQEKEDAAAKLAQVAQGISVVVERYPELKANTQFANLSAAVMDTEEHLQASRRIFNANVSKINQAIVSFPTSMVAKSMKLEKQKMFEATETQRQDVEMNF